MDSYGIPSVVEYQLCKKSIRSYSLDMEKTCESVSPQVQDIGSDSDSEPIEVNGNLCIDFSGLWVRPLMNRDQCKHDLSINLSKLFKCFVCLSALLYWSLNRNWIYFELMMLFNIKAPTHPLCAFFSQLCPRMVEIHFSETILNMNGF